METLIKNTFTLARMVLFLGIGLHILGCDTIDELFNKVGIRETTSQAIVATHQSNDTDSPAHGDTCEDPIVLQAYSYWEAEGWRLPHIWNNDYSWNGRPGCADAAGTELIFKADIGAGQTIKGHHLGDNSIQFRVLTDCNDTTASCSYDNFHGRLSKPDLSYTPPAPGEYYLVIESRYVDTWFSYFNYDLALGIFDNSESSCDDAMDNDGDKLIDCLDPECFGTPSCTWLPVHQETFDSEIPAGWTITGDLPLESWQWDFSEPLQSHSLGGHAMLHDETPKQFATGAYLESPTIDLSGVTEARLVFYHFVKYLNLLRVGHVQVHITNDDGVNWNTIYHMDWFERGYTATGRFDFEQMDITEHLGGSNQIKIRFMFTDGPDARNSYGPYWFIDDFMIFAR